MFMIFYLGTAFYFSFISNFKSQIFTKAPISDNFYTLTIILLCLWVFVLYCEFKLTVWFYTPVYLIGAYFCLSGDT